MESYDPFVDFGGDAPQAESGVVTAPTGPAAPRYGAAPTRDDAEDALHSRLNAAMIDHILIGVAVVIVSLVLHRAVASLTVGLIAILIELLYFFVQESQTGQTIGKRQYGVRVVTLDGGPPGLRAIAYRTLGRILDALPGYHASGLLTMIGTGRRHRQRIGDMIARTTVVAAPGGRALAPRRRWLLPLLTLLATGLSVGVIVSAIHNANANNLQAGFVDGCERGGGTPAYCGCVYSSLAADGYTTTAAWESLNRQVAVARTSGDESQMPGAYLAAVRACGAP